MTEKDKDKKDESYILTSELVKQLIDNKLRRAIKHLATKQISKSLLTE